MGEIVKGLRYASVFVNRQEKDRHVRLGITLVAVILSAPVQAYALQVFVRSAGIISDGPTEIAMLIERLGGLWGLTILMRIAMFLMNIPVVFICCRGISVYPTVFFLAQVFLSSVFLQAFNLTPILTGKVLSVIFGRVIFESAIIITLRENAFSGGTDFIVLSVSNRIGQSVWGYVFFGNAIMRCFYSSIFGWKYAGYSTTLRFIPTGTTFAFHHRYELVTLQVTTIKGPGVVEAYISRSRRGMSYMEAMGGYGKKKIHLPNAVISACKINNAVRVMQEADKHVIIDALEAQQLVGRSYRTPLE